MQLIYLIIVHVAYIDLQKAKLFFLSNAVDIETCFTPSCLASYRLMHISSVKPSRRTCLRGILTHDLRTMRRVLYSFCPKISGLSWLACDQNWAQFSVDRPFNQSFCWAGTVGAALHRGSVRPSHPAAPGSNPGSAILLRFFPRYFHNCLVCGQ